MDDHPGRRSCRPVLVAVVAVLAMLATASAAGAHARLITTDPANDAVLEQSPDAVLLRFDEPVETAFGAVRVYDARARRVDSGDVERPSGREVQVALDRRLARGTYTATWRALSGDGHPVSGAFVFHVGAPGANPAGVAAQVLDDGTPASVSVLFTVVRALDFLLLLLVGGGTLMLVAGLGRASAQTRWRLTRVLAGLSAVLAVVALAGIVLQGAAAGGFGLAEALRSDVVAAVIETRFGTVWLVQAALAAACRGMLLGSRRVPELALSAVTTAALMLLTPSLSGHASVSGGVALVADMAHVVAGGRLGRRARRARARARLERGGALGARRRAVPRFSLLAVGSVSLLVVSGTVSGYLQVGLAAGSGRRPTGGCCCCKVGLVLPLLALGPYHNRRAVPRLRAGIASASETDAVPPHDGRLAAR